MDIYDTDVYKINRQYLSLCGIWPFEVSLINSRVKKRIVEVSLVVLTTLQVLKFFTSPYSMLMVAEIFKHFLPSLVVLTSYLTFCINMENVKKILGDIQADWNSVKTKAEEDIIRKFAKKSRIFTAFLMLMYNMANFTTIFLSTVPIIMDSVFPLNETRTRKLPVQLECFLDPNVHFFEIILITYVLMTIQGVAAISTWTTFIMITQHICGMFELTGHVIDKALDRNGNDISADKARARLIRGIKLHKRTIKLLDVVNVILKYTNFIESIFALLLFGSDFLCLYQMEIETDNIISNSLSVIYFIGHISFMFLTCHIGQKVLDHSSIVFEKACGIPWYYASRETQNLILVLVMRTMEPSYLSIGGLFISSYELFAGVTRLSMSYATVFYSLQ